MKFTINNEEYFIDFEYRRAKNNVTYAKLYQCKEMENAIVVAGVTCSNNDTFVKRIGMKKAVAKLLKEGRIYWMQDKKLRTVFWEQYFRQSPKSKTK